MWKTGRQKSYFYNMRKFHNVIKRDLYDRYANNKSVFELAVGKGGDFQKLYSNNISRVLGYDIDAVSITEAERRLSEYPQNFRDKVRLGVSDLSTEVISGDKDFDVVSAMFSFHYFFRSEDAFLTVLSSIENNLKVGGVFMGVFFDGDLVKARLRRPFKDPHFRITLSSDQSLTSLFGNKINVLQVDTEESSGVYNPEDEYLVDFERFVQSMKLLGFELIETKLFSEYAEILQESRFLKYTERDISFLNRSFVFRRVFDVNMQLECIHKKMKNNKN